MFFILWLKVLSDQIGLAGQLRNLGSCKGIDDLVTQYDSTLQELEVFDAAMKTRRARFSQRSEGKQIKTFSKKVAFNKKIKK